MRRVAPAKAGAYPKPGEGANATRAGLRMYRVPLATVSTDPNLM
jgi:hypothetical protein